MKGRALVLSLVAILTTLAAWMIGYHDGKQIGACEYVDCTGYARAEIANDQAEIADARDEARDQGREQVCNEIRRYKVSMAKDLDENTQICGYDDMDRVENSN